MTINVNKITILGSGTSTGIPTLGCECKVCLSDKIENKRLRSSVLLNTSNEKTIVVDCGPDLRTQLINARVKRIDGAIVTHDHADHSHGIDDLRPFCFFQNSSIPVFAHSKAIETITKKFPYIFDQESHFGDKEILGGGLPNLHFEEVVIGNSKILETEDFTFFLNPHGHTETLGFIHEAGQKTAYIIDANRISKENLKILKTKNIKNLIIDCVRERPHTTHLHLDLALEYAEKISAKFTGLTHLSHNFDHFELTERLEKQVGNHIRPLKDGETLTY